MIFKCLQSFQLHVESYPSLLIDTHNTDDLETFLFTDLTCAKSKLNNRTIKLYI